MSLRFRLVLATVIVGGIGLLGMNVAVFRFVRHNLTDRLDANVREVSERFGVFRFRDVLAIEGFGDRRIPTRGNGQLPQALGNATRGSGGFETIGRTDDASFDGPAGYPTSATLPAVTGGTASAVTRAPRATTPSGTGAATGTPGSPGSSAPSATSVPARPGDGGPPPRSGDRRSLPAGEIYSDVRDAKGKLLTDPKVFSLDENPTLTLELPAKLPTPSANGTMFFVKGTGGTASTYRAAYTKVRLPDGRSVNLLTALPAGDLTSTLDRLRWIQEVATLVVLALIATSGWLLVRLSLRPLGKIEDAAATIAAGDLSHRIADESPRTEIGRLGGSLNRMMSQIESAFADKEASQEQLRRFLADASHELRTPLTAIRGYAQLHRRMHGASDPETDRALERIEDASVRMSTIVEDLLALARHERGPVLVREPVSVAQVVRNVVEDTRIAAPDRTITLQVDAPGLVLGDGTRLHQALSNIVDNAVLHTQPGTAVDVRASGDGQRVRVEIADHGPGIPAEHLAHLFEPFYRVDPGRSRHTGGAGLGLAIADAVVRAHGGTITVSSPPGGGATFVVDLPAGGTDAAGAADTPGTTVAADARDGRDGGPSLRPSGPDATGGRAGAIAPA